jgi:ATP-dependent RNA helicase RhlE
MTFNDLLLIQPLIDALNKKGYKIPTPIQEKAIPHILKGSDIFGCAQTGTGKTASFALPVLQLLNNRKTDRRSVKALVLAPTRELTMQISENFTAYSSHLDIKHALIFGGVSQHRQVQALRSGVDAIVATPGRLLDLMNQGYVKLDAVEFFILDEADRMLDMGFINDIRKIVSKLPAKKQSLFFSATASAEILKLSGSILKNPVNVSVNPVSSSAPLISQSVYYVEKENKRSLLNHILTTTEIPHALVFTRTKRGADKVAKDLNRNGIKAEAIHGNKSQNARDRALKSFKNHNIRVLVATDVASRGIDVDKLSHVINFEIPEQAETYVHRIGRTGRAGSTGIALSFCDRTERSYMKDISKLIRKEIEVVSKHPFINK